MALDSAAAGRAGQADGGGRGGGASQLMRLVCLLDERHVAPSQTRQCADLDMTDLRVVIQSVGNYLYRRGRSGRLPRAYWLDVHVGPVCSAHRLKNGMA